MAAAPTWILDASVAVRWFLQDERHPHADRVLEVLLARPGAFAVPELFAFEVLAVLCRTHPSPVECYVRGMIPVLQCGLLRQPMTEALARGAGHFLGRGLTGYDAAYAALARESGSTWLTFDAAAHRAIRRDRVSWLLDDALPPGM